MKDDPITVGNSEPEPDLAVVHGSLADYRSTKPTSAELAVEVAIGTIGIDRAKAAIYAQTGIPEFWLVQPEAGVTAAFRNPVAGEYLDRSEVPAEADLASTSLPGFTFNLAAALKE